ncbi:MAG: MBL fold metallo-hydrolase [Ruminococcus flavefaciens]|nr:MBL fold metallo-hydrolase [Ruminococcus flavefaciens]
MIVNTLQLGELRANCHIALTTPNQCVAVDIGGDSRLLLEFLNMKKLKLSKILLTHGHFDHMNGVEEVAVKTGAEVFIHENDAPMLNSAGLSLADSISCMKFNPVSRYTVIHDGDVITDGEYEFRVMHTAGHSMGSVCYICDDTIFSGDTLFCCSIGRTDFAGSSPELMIDSLERLYKISGNYTILTGHGDKTELEYEKKSNPYFRRFRK